MRRAALVALLLLATGCGGTAETARPRTERAGNVALGAICPGAHQVYDSLVASNPASQTEFLDHLQSLRQVGDLQARNALAPVLRAARNLVAAGRGPRFEEAQDGVYRSVVGLDKACRTAGSYILH